uniref:LSDAT_euk domain-containing protein n=2 Tax=Caenorhabditis tropicalis TaxID=1561998 RepID=A0A1I7TXD6_9PELO
MFGVLEKKRLENIQPSHADTEVRDPLTVTSTESRGRGIDEDGVFSATQAHPQMTNSENDEQPGPSRISPDQSNGDKTLNVVPVINVLLCCTQLTMGGSKTALEKIKWMKETFSRLECSRFVSSIFDSKKCSCGRHQEAHRDIPEFPLEFPGQRIEEWNFEKDSVQFPTNAFGRLEFHCAPHPFRAQYIRLSADTEPALIMSLLEDVWQISPPRLIITVHGGTDDFELQPKLVRAFCKGIWKAVSTTGAWIITSGCNTGVAKLVADALNGAQSAVRNKIICIGIASWGMLKKRQDLIGEGRTVTYYSSPSNGSGTLNNRHSHFLLVDDGTVGRNGADLILRKRLEMFISQKQKTVGGSRNVPVVSIVLEGGLRMIHTVHDYMTDIQSIPVVVCDGSGRAADLLAFAHQNITQNGFLSDGICSKLFELIKKTFACSGARAHQVLRELTACAQNKNLLTVFRLGENREQDVDHAILTALFKGKNCSPPDQLALALVWNRVDIARSDIFALEYEWHPTILHKAMMKALLHDRVDFVHVLLEQGVDMTKFLTISKLEKLYNTNKGPQNTLYYIMADIVRVKPGHCFRLPDIGVAIEKLMGNGYKSFYSSSEFGERYERWKNMKEAKKKTTDSVVPTAVNNRDPDLGTVNQAALSGTKQLSNHMIRRKAFHKNPTHSSRSLNLNESHDCASELEEERLFAFDGMHVEPDFRYPYNELMIWAVLTRRKDMAMCMWQHGQEAMAKSLVACRLYENLATETAEDHLAVGYYDELKECAEKFRTLSVELLDYCYHADDTQTLHLLTHELSNWSNRTCLSLAVMVNNEPFLAHRCCQILLADVWHGGLRIRTHSNLKVIAGLLFFPSILLLELKEREELSNEPVTAPEEQNLMNLCSSHISTRRSNSTAIDTSSSEEDEEDDSLQLNTNGSPTAESEKTGSSPLSPRNWFSCHGTNKNRANMSNRFSACAPVSTPSKNGNSTNRPSRMKTAFKEIKASKRFYEFYSAPITTFWSWTLSYALFIFLSTYTLLVKTPQNPTMLEYFLIAYVGVYTMEQFRRILISDVQSCLQKVRLYLSSFWNCITILACFVYIVGFFYRTFGDPKVGRVILACASVFWTVKILDYLSVHPKIGPYVTMTGKMIQNMSCLVIMLAVALFSYGLPRQSITYPDEEWHWILVRNIFLKPYFMLYGEVYADEIDTCGDEAWENHLENGGPVILGNGTTGTGCVTGFWIPPILQPAFMLVANILIISMLNALFNNVYNTTIEKSQQIYLFQRYRQVMEYAATPFIPPPFTILQYIYYLVKFIRVAIKNRGKSKEERKSIRSMFDSSLKLFLDYDQIEKLHYFEEDCMDDLLRKKQNEENSSNKRNEIQEHIRMLLDQNSAPEFGQFKSPSAEHITMEIQPSIIKLHGSELSLRRNGSEEYTSITDSIDVGNSERGNQIHRSNSNSNDGSGANSDVE